MAAIVAAAAHTHLTSVLGERALLSCSPHFTKRLCKNRKSEKGQPEVRGWNYSHEAQTPLGDLFSTLHFVPKCWIDSALFSAMPQGHPSCLTWLLDSGWPWLRKIGFKGISRLTWFYRRMAGKTKLGWCRRRHT